MLATPADTGQLYVQNLERLVNDYPQSGILQVMLARAGNEQHIGKAATYFNPRILHKLLHNPEDLKEVAASDIIALTDDKPYSGYLNAAPVTESVTTTIEEEEPAVAEIIEAPVEHEASPVTETEDVLTEEQEAPEIEEETIAAQELVTDTEEEATLIEEPIADDAEEQIAIEEPETTTENNELPQAEDTTPEPDEEHKEVLADYGYIPHLPQDRFDEEEEPITADEDAGIEPLIAADEATTEPEQFIIPEPDAGQQDTQSFSHIIAADNYDKEEEHFRQDIEDDIYDEIVSIEDIGFEAIAYETGHPTFSIPDAEVVEDEQQVSPIVEHNEDDYASFDQKLNELRNAEAPAQEADTYQAAAIEQPTAPVDEPAAQPVQAFVGESSHVSRYNDDKMPYSFMWWLDKTRKEHADSFRPYATEAPASTTPPPKEKADTQQASAPLTNKPADELQQQYYENIFSLTSVSGIERDAETPEVDFDHNKKEDVIIERFIHTDPQIRPLAADKLDNENKAKRSSEDQDELVTETLARIYTDQMLYHKAIATYKKLILKFPEKKLYFAAQIEQLEKKTN